MNENNIITLTNGGIHWVLVWYEAQEVEEPERKFYNIELQEVGTANSIYEFHDLNDICSFFNYLKTIAEK